MTAPPCYRADGIVLAAGGRRLLDGASLELVPGTLHALLGSNGAGKSSLLRVLSAELAPDAGSVTLNGRALSAWSPRERARQRAVLPQSEALRFGFTAAQVVALGRLPCPRHGDAAEAALVQAALEAAGVGALAQRRYPTLSGGERARVQLARVLAQVWEPVEHGPRYLLLDEPTASLDLAHQHDCMALALRLARDGAGVLAILHDPNLALRYADTVTLMQGGRVLACGPAVATLTAPALQATYGVPVALHALPGMVRPLIVAAGGPP